MFLYSLKNKLSITIFLVISILGSFATYAVFLYSKNILFESEKASLLTIATEQAEQISIALKQSTHLSELISQQDFVINYLNNPEKEIQDSEVLSRFESYNINDIFSSIYLLDKEGLTLVSTTESFVSNNYSFRDYFKEAILGENYTDISVGITSKELGYYFSSPIEDENNRIIGVIVLKMKPNVVNDLVIGHQLDSQNKEFELLAVIDDYSVIFHSNDESKLFKSVSKLSPELLSEISNKKRFADQEITSLGYKIELDEIRSIEDSTSLEVLDKELEDNFLLNVIKIEGYPFYVLVIENENILVSKAKEISFTLGVFIFISVIISLILVNFLVRSFTKPLTELNEVVIKASKGDLGQRSLINTKDEIGILGKNFNSLIKSLQENLKNIEKKVSERTKQVENVNKSMVGRELKMVELKKQILELENKLRKYYGKK